MKELNSDDFIATQEELEEMGYLQFEYEILGYKHIDMCHICYEVPKKENKNLKWLIIAKAGSGSMDEYICEDCLKKINKLLQEES